MKMNAYCVFDVAIGSFNSPFFMQTDGLAIRGFSEQVNNPESQIGKNPDQFTLYRVGEFDDQEGMLIPHDPRSLGVGSQFKDPEQQDAFRAMADNVEKLARDVRALMKELM